MFPNLAYKIQEIESKKASTSAKIQSIINFLSSDILTMDLSHIIGEKIAKGD